MDANETGATNQEDDMNNPSYLLSSTGCEKNMICRGCAEAVKQNPETKRWFITMGHPGFNSVTNNRNGYVSEQSARYGIEYYSLG